MPPGGRRGSRSRKRRRRTQSLDRRRRPPAPDRGRPDRIPESTGRSDRRSAPRCRPCRVMRRSGTRSTRFLPPGTRRWDFSRFPEAEKAVLLRRVSLDLTGLVPTADELDAFPGRYLAGRLRAVVDRLLASPRFGERWGRHWMDVWRYSDWDGFGAEIRESQPHIWRWRDWIVESLNDGKGYDRMIVEMLAADEIAPDDPSASGPRASSRGTGTSSAATPGSTTRSNIQARRFSASRSTAPAATTTSTTRSSSASITSSAPSSNPHDVRADPVSRPAGHHEGRVSAGSTMRDSSAPTFLFVRGNEKDPDKDPSPPGGGSRRRSAREHSRSRPSSFPAEASLSRPPAIRPGGVDRPRRERS